MNKYILLFNLVLLYITSPIAQAAIPTTRIVNPDACKSMANSTKPFVLVLHSGDKIIKSIVDCAKDANLTAASLTGLGLLANPKLSYYNLQTKKLDYKTFPGVYELTVLNGNIMQMPNRSFADIHAVLGNNQYQTLTGHLEEATALVRVDVIFTPLDLN